MLADLPIFDERQHIFLIFRLRRQQPWFDSISNQISGYAPTLCYSYRDGFLRRNISGDRWSASKSYKEVQSNGFSDKYDSDVIDVERRQPTDRLREDDVAVRDEIKHMQVFMLKIEDWEALIPPRTSNMSNNEHLDVISQTDCWFNKSGRSNVSIFLTKLLTVISVFLVLKFQDGNM